MTVQHPTAVVFSSTGTQGLSVTKALSQAGYTIRALTRSPSSAKTISAFQGLKNVVPTLYDHADPSNLPRILAGAQIVYAIPVPDDPAMMASPGSPESISKLPSEKQQGITIADAVQGAGTPLLIWGSAPDAAAASKGAYPSIPTFQDKIEVQEYITSLGLESVYIALGMFSDNWVNFEWIIKGDDGKLHVRVPHAVLESKMATFFTSRDLGTAVVRIIEQYHAQNLRHKTLSLGERYYSVAEQMALIKEISGLEVVLDQDVYGGEPNSEADLMYRFMMDTRYPYFPAGTFPDSVVEALGIESTSLKTYFCESLLPALGL